MLFGSNRLMKQPTGFRSPWTLSLSSLLERPDTFAAFSHKQGFLLWIGFLLNLLGEFLESLNGILLSCMQTYRQVLGRTYWRCQMLPGLQPRLFGLFECGLVALLQGVTLPKKRVFFFPVGGAAKTFFNSCQFVQIHLLGPFTERA